MADLHLIRYEQVKQIKWAGDYIEYDLELFSLGSGQDRFLVLNFDFTDEDIANFDYSEFDDGNTCVVWNYKKTWVAKLFPKDWSLGLYKNIDTDFKMPALEWERNDTISELITFKNDPSLTFVPDLRDFDYDLIWYIHPKFVDKEVWAFKCHTKNKVSHGVKNMGYVTPVLPELTWERNPSIPESVTFKNDPTVDFNFGLWDIDYVLTWYVDSQSVNDKVWVFKYYIEDRVANGEKYMGYLAPTMPKFTWERNSDIPKSITFENDPTIDYKIDAWNAGYELVWHISPEFVNEQDGIWAVRCKETNNTPNGFKEMGYLTPILPKVLDVIFISYNEPNAEVNWQRVLDKAPWAKRVDRVKGIFNAHKAAAELSTTDMFYVVDGDAWLVDDFEFNFVPNILDRECTHIWRSKNPINGLEYGYGGVKMFYRDVVVSAREWTTLDMSTTITSKMKIVETISNITAFDTDEFSTWRSAFRECVKLCYNIQQDPADAVSKDRLERWLTVDNGHKFGKYSKNGAAQAAAWFGTTDYEGLRMINSRDWLEQTFKQNGI